MAGIASGAAGTTAGAAFLPGVAACAPPREDAAVSPGARRMPAQRDGTAPRR